jgi:hypothetical protein
MMKVVSTENILSHTSFFSSLLTRENTKLSTIDDQPTNWFRISVDGQYVEEGWVDKTCKICKKDTRGEPRQVDKLGRYAHVACLENPKPANFFAKIFAR